jgi:hypothetical protein
MERRRATRIASQSEATTGGMATAPMGDRAVPQPQFPLRMRNAAMAYASSASTDVAARGGRPCRHVPAAKNLTTTTNDESYHGSASELPPATSHGYAEWDCRCFIPEVVDYAVEDRDRETENSKVCARTRDTRFIQVRAAKVASPTSCLGDQVWRPALGVGCDQVPG